MGEHNSPYFDAGTADGARDRAAVEACPMGWAEGMDGEKAWSWMYKRGYNREWEQAIPHGSCKQCRPDLHPGES